MGVKNASMLGGGGGGGGGGAGVPVGTRFTVQVFPRVEIMPKTCTKQKL